MNEKKYRDLFIDFDDTIYDTYGNANMALREVYKELNLGERLNSEEEFYDRYWRTNIELWGDKTELPHCGTIQTASRRDR